MDCVCRTVWPVAIVYHTPFVFGLLNVRKKYLLSYRIVFLARFVCFGFGDISINKSARFDTAKNELSNHAWITTLRFVLRQIPFTDCLLSWKRKSRKNCIFIRVSFHRMIRCQWNRIPIIPFQVLRTHCDELCWITGNGQWSKLNCVDDGDAQSHIDSLHRPSSSSFVVSRRRRYCSPSQNAAIINWFAGN